MKYFLSLILFFLCSCSKDKNIATYDFNSSSWEDLNINNIYNDFFVCINDSVRIAQGTEQDSNAVNNPYIYYSKDNCKTWQKIISNVGMGEIKYHNNSYIMVNYGWQTAGVYTSKNLKNWTSITPPTANINANAYADIISNNNKIFVIFNKLFSSNNDGISWKEELDDVYYIKSYKNNIFVEHDNSNAYDYSFDNGVSWKRDSFKEDMGFTFSDAVLTEDGVYAVSRYRDSVIFTDYQFKDWKAISALQDNGNKKIWKIGNYFILGGKSHYYSKDNCKTWQKFDNPFDIGYYTESAGYLYAHSEYRLYRKKIN